MHVMTSAESCGMSLFQSYIQKEERIKRYIVLKGKEQHSKPLTVPLGSCFLNKHALLYFLSINEYKHMYLISSEAVSFHFAVASLCNLIPPQVKVCCNSNSQNICLVTGIITTYSVTAGGK